MIGVVLNENDIYEILVNYDYSDHNILADNRYGLNDLGFDNYPNREKGVNSIRENVYSDLEQS